MGDQSSPRSDSESTDAASQGGRRRPSRTDVADNRIVERRDPVDQSESGLVSRDYQPRHGGPELIASWPLGPTPSQTEPGAVDWEVTSSEYVQLQRNLTVNHFLGPIEYTKIYAGIRGRGRVEGGGTLSLKLEPIHLEGDEFQTEITLTNDDDEPFMTPMVEFTPDGRVYREHSFIGREMYGGYVFSAKVEDGTGYLDQGTAVHLWSE
ncbi:hypothetical protein [Haloarchaeobius sp. DFWS5]|uniref:hypothetical protein n=1 Tax=Haloarchaeobius sp. DFWS5 TaxID=3446114 RepID=UPI003EBA4192